MTVSYDLINGVSLGVEYVAADEEAEIDNSCILLDLLIFRVLIELD